MAYIAIAAVVVSAGATVYSQQQAAAAQEDAANYNNIIAANQAKAQEQEAAEQAKRDRITQRKALARLRTQLAANGRSTSAGTPLDILGESAANFDLGIRDAARVASINAANTRAEGAMGLWKADQAQTAANINSVATVADGVSSYYKAKK
jgi:predicted negative regulator of RcsB-dependent stress response